MLYENGYDEVGNISYILSDEVDPNFYQLACPCEPDGYYPGCSDVVDVKAEVRHLLSEDGFDLDEDDFLPFDFD